MHVQLDEGRHRRHFHHPSRFQWQHRRREHRRKRQCHVVSVKHQYEWCGRCNPERPALLPMRQVEHLSLVPDDHEHRDQHEYLDRQCTERRFTDRVAYFPGTGTSVTFSQPSGSLDLKCFITIANLVNIRSLTNSSSATNCANAGISTGFPGTGIVAQKTYQVVMTQ